MPPVPNPHNGFVPRVGQLVRVVGGFHPKSVGRVVEVTRVGGGFAETRYLRDDGEWAYGSGELGGLEATEVPDAR